MNAPTLDIGRAVPMPAALPDQTFQQTLDATRLKALVVLEADATRSQYQEADMLLAGRLWTTYLGFVTGMILALVGATFVLGKLQEETSELSTKASGMELSFKSASPGLMLACLGVILMVCTILTHNNIEVTHRSTYLSDSVPMGAASGTPAPTKPEASLRCLSIQAWRNRSPKNRRGEQQ